MKKIIKITSVLSAVFLILPHVGYSQEAQQVQTSSYFSNALFNVLLFVILLLLALIAVVANVAKNVAGSDYVKEKLKRIQEKKKLDAGKTLGILVLFLLASQPSYAQEAVRVSAPNDWLIGGLDMFTFFGMIFVILCEISVLVILVNILKIVLKSDKEKALATPAVKPEPKKTILDKFNASVEVEKEKDILLDHDYDGIKELDNNLPPWWKYGFYLTILVAFVYMIHYHGSKTGDLQIEEYTKSIEKAKAEVAEYMKNAAGNVDESTVKQLEGADIETGKELFIANCAACHGKVGEGTVGPNLTDKFWLHSGSLADIFKSIKYGWVDKGMKAWKEDLSPMQIAQISSYIKTLQGTNPPNAKAAQGDPYVEVASAPGDSLTVVGDSLQLDSLKIIPADTLKKK